LPRIHSSAFELTSLVIYSLSELSKRRPAGLKHPELKLGPSPVHFVTSGFDMTSVYPDALFAKCRINSVLLYIVGFAEDTTSRNQSGPRRRTKVYIPGATGR
jgi:hypothetical protein